MNEENVVFIPGTLTDERVFKDQIHLFKKHYIVNVRTQYALEEMIESVKEAPFDFFHLIGFSMGGYVAQEFAVKNSMRVKSLTSIASSALGYPEKEKEVVLKTLPLIRPDVFKGITEKRLKEYLHPHSYGNSEIKKLIKEMGGEDAADVYLRQLRSTLDRRNLTRELSELEFKINFIAGEDDQIVKWESMRESQSKIPNSELFTIKECGHFVTLEKSTELNNILEKLIT